MSGYDEDLSVFLKGFGFSDEELYEAMDELAAYRSIPGTTISRYMNRVINALAEEDRSAFLKGVLLGIAIRNVADTMAEPDLTEEEKRIAREIERLKLSE
jgi:hypothetical protein